MKILIVEDDKLLGNSLKRGFDELGWIVDLAQDGKEGLFLAKNSAYQVMLIDWMLPRMSGIEMLEEIRQAGMKTPAIVITARSALNDKLAGLDLADDYIVKPFEMAELMARIKALHRRSLREAGNVICHGRLTLNIPEQTVLLDQVPLKLTLKEFDLLEIFASNPNKVMTKSELHGLLYCYEDEPESNSLDVIVARLRKKLSSAQIEIVTIRGKGYLFRVAQSNHQP